ncbi:MAG: hypothetical protein NTX73_12650 [Rhodobacterales bacterium]|nr:hypothetical protein [Rhodobacterales bacterium]
MLVTVDDVLVALGDNRAVSNLASVRKSVLAVPFCFAAEKGLFGLDETLADLGIDETAKPLTQTEKSATIRDLLMSRSGVYLPSRAETDSMPRCALHEAPLRRERISLAKTGISTP